MTDNQESTTEVPTAAYPMRNLHVKRVPWSAWARARQNALLSGIPFRDFVIQLLARSVPLSCNKEP